MQILENVSNFIKVGSGRTLEIFKHSTYVTSAGSGTLSVAFAERSGFANGDHVYIGTNSYRTISDSSLPTTGAGNVIIDAPATFSNNEAIVRKRDVSVSATADDYVTVYDSEDFDTAVSQPIGLDASNQVRLSVPAGSYGIRYSDEDDNTLFLEYDTVLRWDSIHYANRYASDGHGTSTDPWIGWEGVFAINTRVHFPAGYYSTTGATFTVATGTGQILVTGDGTNVSFIRVSADAPALKFTATGATPSFFYNLKIRDLTIQPTATNTTSLLRLENLDNGSSLHNVYLDPNAQTVATAIHCLNVNDCSFYDIQVAGTTAKYFTNGVVFATDSADIRGQIHFFSPTFKNCTVGTDFTATLAGYNNIDFYSPTFVVTGSSYGTVAIRTVAQVDQINVFDPKIQKYTNGNLHTGATGVNIVGGSYSDCKNAGNTDGAAIELIDCTFGNIAPGAITSAYDGIVMSGTSQGLTIGSILFLSITNQNIIDTSTGATGNRRLRGAHSFPTKITTFTTLDTTPSVAGGDLCKTANGGATSITTFDDGILGQEIAVIVKDANTTFVHGTIILQGAVNFTAALNDAIWFKYDGTNWYEQSRNSAQWGGALVATGSVTASGFISGAVGFLRIGTDASVTLTASAITATNGYHQIAGGPGNLNNITSSASTGDVMVLRQSGAGTITVVHKAGGTGNIRLVASASFAMDTVNDHIVLINNGGNWHELSRADNGT